MCHIDCPAPHSQGEGESSGVGGNDDKSVFRYFPGVEVLQLRRSVSRLGRWWSLREVSRVTHALTHCRRRQLPRRRPLQYGRHPTSHSSRRTGPPTTTPAIPVRQTTTAPPPHRRPPPPPPPPPPLSPATLSAFYTLITL